MIGQQDVGEEYRRVSLNQNFKRRLFAKSNQLQKSLNNSSHLNFLQDSLRDVHVIYENQYYLIKRVENVNKCMYFTQIVPSDINNFDISSMNHENILQIHQEDNIFIAEPMLMTLQTYIYQQQDISNDLEQIVKQIVNFISFLHSQNLAHTELSTKNFLINEKLQIKAVPLPQEGVQYRAPERIIGYDVENMKSEDMFQLGCIILELLARKPVLESDDETNQMLKYSLFLGRPQEIIYRNIYHQLPDTSPVDIDKYLCNSDQKLINLIPQLLVYDPEKRATIQQVQNYLNQVYPAYRPSSKSSISNSPLSLKSQRMTPYSLRNRNKRYGNLKNGSPNYYYQDETPSINLYDESPNDLSPKSNFSKKRFDEQMRTIAEETSLNNDGMSQLREKILSGKQNHPSVDNNQGAQQYNKSQHPRNYSSASNTQNNQRLNSAQKPQTPSRYKQGSSLLFDNDDNLKPQIIQDRMTPLSNRRSNNNSFYKNNNHTPGKGFFIDVPNKEKNIQDHMTSFQHLQKIFGEENKQKTDDEKKRKLEEDMRKQAEEERRKRIDEENKRKKEEEEKQKKDQEEEGKKRRDEAEKKKKDEEERKKREEEEKRKKDEEEKIKRDIEVKKKKEEDEKRQKDEEEKRKKDDLQKKKDEEQKQMLNDLKNKQLEEEKNKKLEEELRKKLEEEQKKKELELKRQMEEESKKRDQERQKEFEAQKIKQEQEMKKKIEEEQKKIEEQLRKQFEQQQKQKEEELRKKEEEQKKKDEELKKKEEEKLKLEQELKKKDEALKLKEEEDRKLREELAKKENQQKYEEQQKMLKAQKEAEEKLRKQLEEEQQKLKKLQEELLKKKNEDDEIAKQKQIQDQKAKEEEIRQLKEKQEQLAEQERKQKEIAAELERKEKLAQEALKNQQLQIQEEAKKKEEQMLQELKKKEEDLKKQKEQAELERKKKEEELEQQRQREQEEIQKKQELLKQKEQELERQRKAEDEKQREFEEQKKRELENQKKKEMELNQLKQQELEKLKEIEEKRQRDEQEKQNKQKEEEKRLQEIEKQKKKELQDLMKQKELERQKLKELEEKEKELAKKKGEDQKKMAELEKQKKYQQQQQKEFDENIKLQKEDSQIESSKKPLKQPKSVIQTEQSLEDKKPIQNNNQGNIVILPESMQRQQMISNILQQEIEFNEIYRQRQGYTHYRFKNNQLSTPNSNINVNTRYSQPTQQNPNGSKVSPQMYDSKQSFYPQSNHDNSEVNPSLNFRTPRINTDHSTIKSALINTNDRNNQNQNLKMESPVSNIPRIKQKIQLNGNTIVVEETPENSINSLGNQPSYQPVYKEQQPRIINKNKPIIPPLRSIATSLPPATDRRKQSPPSTGTDRKSKENKKYNTLNKSVDVKKKKKKSKGGNSEIKGSYNNDDYKMPPLSARNDSFQYLQDERTKFRQSHEGQLITQSNTDSIPSILNPARMSQQHMYLQTKPDQPTVFNTRLLARPPTFLIQKDTDED